MCAQCHTATTRPIPPSVQFPEKVTADFIHRGDWISRHAIEQQVDPASCTKCHGRNYCQSCHAFQNVAPGGGSPRDPHPSGWLNVHGLQARANIVACAACHDQGTASICVGCHRVGGVGGNPHPPGWKGTASQAASQANCRACHS
jgi:RecJ-like exonuclease